MGKTKKLLENMDRSEYGDLNALRNLYHIPDSSETVRRIEVQMEIQENEKQ